MTQTIIENPIINSPFAEPQQHHELDNRGNPTGSTLPSRRKSTYLTPIPQPRKQAGVQLDMFDARPEEVRHEHDYIPDFLARIRHDGGDTLNLIIEVTSQRYDAKEAKADTIRKLWLPSVTALDRYGRWEFIEILDPWDAQNSIRRALKQIEWTETA